MDHLVLWAGFFPPDIDLNSIREKTGHARLSLVLGKSDPLAGPDVVEKQLSILKKNGIEFERIQFDGGHRLDRGALAELFAPNDRI